MVDTSRDGEFNRIELGSLIEGMIIDTDIYTKSGSSYVLLCSKTLLTQEIINRLRENSKLGVELYVPKKDYDAIVEQYKYFMSSINNIKAQRKYSETTKRYRGMLDNIAKGIIKTVDTTRMAMGMLSEIENTPISIIECINRIRVADEYLCTHGVNVGYLNGLIATWLGLPEKDRVRLIEIGALHDIGKLKIPQDILNKPGKLTEEEFSIIKKHPIYSSDMLRASGIHSMDLIMGVRGHHEKMNGSGYPDMLQGNDISLFARITAVSDIYDAMVTKRPYKRAFSPFEIMGQLVNSKFSSLDMNIVNTFVNNYLSSTVGKQVVLSNGKIGEVMYVNSASIEYPVVKVDGVITKTSDELRCMSLHL